MALRSSRGRSSCSPANAARTGRRRSSGEPPATAGLALGPAVGGRTHRAVQLAVDLRAAGAAGASAYRRSPAGRRRPSGAPKARLDRRPELALGLLSAGLTAALFLLVVLLTEGWGLIADRGRRRRQPDPDRGADRRPDCAPRRRPRGRWRSPGRSLIAGGLAALGVLPGRRRRSHRRSPVADRRRAWRSPCPHLTAAALGGRDPDGSRAAETLAARHAGIVAGILLLTPLLSLQLEAQHDAGRDAGTALLLDAPLPPQTKLAIGNRDRRSDPTPPTARLPDLGPTFAAIEADAEEADRPAVAELEAGIDDQLERAATHAFSLPFLGAALFAALALIPMRRDRGGVGCERPAPANLPGDRRLARCDRRLPDRRRRLVQATRRGRSLRAAIGPGPRRAGCVRRHRALGSRRRRLRASGHARGAHRCARRSERPLPPSPRSTQSTRAACRMRFAPPWCAPSTTRRARAGSRGRLPT